MGRRGPQPWRTNRSRALRSKPISADEELWSEPRNRQLGGYKFIRQAPIGPYFVDFLCREHKIIIEVDGDTHSTDAELAADQTRSNELVALGFRIFRVHNTDVFENIDGVCDTLLAFIAEAPP